MTTEPSAKVGAALVRTRVLDIVAVILITAFALWLRIWGNGFGLPSLLFSDERMAMDMALSEGLTAQHFGWPPGLGYIIKAVLAVYWLIGLIGGRLNNWADLQAEVARNPTTVYLIGRSACGVMGALTVLLVAAYGLRWYGRWAAYSGALLLAVNATHGRESHYATADVPMVLFITLASGYAVAAWDKPDRRRLDTVALLLGCAIGIKYHAVLALSMPLLIHWRHHAGSTWRALVWSSDLRRSLAIALGAAIGISWSGFLRPTTLVHDLGALLIKPFAPYPGHARGFLSWLFDPRASLAADLGWPGLILVLFAIAGAVRRRRGPDVMLLAVLLPIMLASAVTSVRIMRYILPALPALCLLSGVWLVEAAQRARRWSMACFPAALAVVAVWPLHATVQRDIEFSAPDTRNIAAAWASQHLPVASRVLAEQGDYTPPLDEDRFNMLWWRPAPKSRLRLKDQHPEGLSLRDYPSADYAILTNAAFNRYSRTETRARYPRISAAYLGFFTDIREHRRIARFAPQRGRTQGPLIAVYDLRKQQPPHARPSG